MAEVTVRDLRNQGGQILERVAGGETLMVTRDGRPIAQCKPVDFAGIDGLAVVAVPVPDQR
jgi:antitoxin (DNA-binding transcriptional repressor) of toxin-antitoxin stability system